MVIARTFSFSSRDTDVENATIGQQQSAVKHLTSAVNRGYLIPLNID